jgi:hypothetical protein
MIASWRALPGRKFTELKNISGDAWVLLGYRSDCEGSLQHLARDNLVKLTSSEVGHPESYSNLQFKNKCSLDLAQRDVTRVNLLYHWVPQPSSSWFGVPNVDAHSSCQHLLWV